MSGVAVLGQTRSAVVDAARDARAAWSARATAIAGMVLLAALLPVAPLGLGFDRLASDLYLAAAAVGLGIVVGLGGMPSLGQGAFIALGAFATAVLETKAGWPTEGAVLAGVVLAALAGGAVGIVAGRLRPALVAVFTWLLAWLVAIGLTAFPSISGGAQGIAVEQGSIAGIELSATVHYELGVGLTALAVLLFWVLRRSPVGVALSAPASTERPRKLSGSRWPDCVPRPSPSVPRLRRRPAASVSISPWWPMPQRTGRCSRRSSSSPSCSAEPSRPRAGSSA